MWPAVLSTAMIFFLTSISAMGCWTSIIVAQEPDDPAVSGAFWPREGNVECNFELKCLYSLDLLLVFPEKKRTTSRTRSLYLNQLPLFIFHYALRVKLLVEPPDTKKADFLLQVLLEGSVLMALYCSFLFVPLLQNVSSIVFIIICFSC